MREIGSQGRVGVSLTARDLLMLEWLDFVRLADVEAVRMRLGSLSQERRTEGVGLRVAQTWIERMRRAGLVGSERPQYRAGQVVWATHAVSGRPAPNPYSATAVHALDVARTTAYLAARSEVLPGPDLAPLKMPRDHIADAVLSWPNGARQFLEVERSVKTQGRLEVKLRGMAERWAREGVAGTLYAVEPRAGRAVERAASAVLSEANRSLLRVVPMDSFR